MSGEVVTVDPRTLQRIMVRALDGKVRFVSRERVTEWMRRGADTASIAEMLRVREADVWNALNRDVPG